MSSDLEKGNLLYYIDIENKIFNILEIQQVRYSILQSAQFLWADTINVVTSKKETWLLPKNITQIDYYFYPCEIGQNFPDFRFAFSYNERIAVKLFKEYVEGRRYNIQLK